MSRPRLLLVAGLLLGVVLDSVGASPASAQPTTTAEAVPFVQQQDVVFGEVHGTGLLMDVFRPTGRANGLGIVDVVSGSWYSDRGKIRDHARARIFDILCARGYTVYAVRPGSRTRYTLQEMDTHVKRAIRVVKARAADDGVDPDRLGLTGASAGGHLATLAALTPSEAAADAKDPLERHDTRVAAVGVFFPPTDFLEWRDGTMADRTLLRGLMVPAGAPEPDDVALRDLARSLSPRHRIAKADIPFLIIHGDADPLVPFEQSERFVGALTDAGIPAQLVVKRGGAHPWPTIAEEVAILADWFDAKLVRP